MKVKRTEQIYIGENETISKLCHISKNLYNQTNYVLKQQFIKKEKLSSYEDLVKLFQTPSENDEENNYQKLPSQTAQWTIRKVREAWNSYFKAIKAWKKHPEKFTEMPKPPKYKNKNGEFLLVFTNQQCKIEDGILKFPKIMNLEVETRLENVDLREVRIIPQGVGYIIEIVYMKEIEDIAKGESKKIMGIDIGLRNIVTIGDSISREGIAVKGGVLKSINQYYNKEKARLKSISDRQNKDKRLTKREKRLLVKRNRKIKDIMHKLSKAIVQYAKTRNIEQLPCSVCA